LCVYLEYQVMARKFAPRHCFFFPTVVNSTMRRWRDPPGEWGKYSLTGGKLNLTPVKGKPWVADFKTEGADWNIGSNSCQKITAVYPANAKLNGRYTSGQSYGGNSSASTYVFSPDGAYTIENVGSARSSASSGLSVNAQKGRYRLSANTWELTANGQTTRHLSYEIPAGSGTQMVIDGFSWKKN